MSFCLFKVDVLLNDLANPYNGATRPRAVHELIEDINDDDRGNYSGQSTVKEEGWPSSPMTPMRNGLYIVVKKCEFMTAKTNVVKSIVVIA